MELMICVDIKCYRYDMRSEQTPLYVRLGEDPTRRLERAVSASGKTKRQLIEDAVREHLTDDGLVVGRIALHQREPEILTLAEAAALLRVEESELASAAERGEIPAGRIGASWRFSRAAVLSWLDGGRSTRTRPATG
jgi:excisionase family DNA binding protein